MTSTDAETFYGADAESAIRAAGIVPHPYYRERGPRFALFAEYKGSIGRTKVYRVPVLVYENSSADMRTKRVALVFVIAASAAIAANYVRDNMYATRPETEIYAFGPRCGVTYRYIGWHTAVGNAIARGVRLGDNGEVA